MKVDLKTIFGHFGKNIALARAHRELEKIEKELALLDPSSEEYAVKHLLFTNKKKLSEEDVFVVNLDYSECCLWLHPDEISSATTIEKLWQSFYKPFESLVKRRKRLTRLIRFLKSIQHVCLENYNPIQYHLMTLQSIRIENKCGEEINKTCLTKPCFINF